jgi:hypothetical protein
MSDHLSLPPIDGNLRAEFLKTEYQEAAKAYALGVQVGQAIMGSYLVGTGILATFLGVAIGQLKPQFAIALLPIVFIVGSIGIIGSIAIIKTRPVFDNLGARSADSTGLFSMPITRAASFDHLVGEGE